MTIISEIYLDNEWNTYYPGQTINGRIEYTFPTPIKVIRIYVEFSGKAYTEILNAQRRRLRYRQRRYLRNHEEYFKIAYYLLGSDSGTNLFGRSIRIIMIELHFDDVTNIAAGQQVYNFSCVLPSVLPQSIEGHLQDSECNLRYTIKVTLVMAGGSTQELTVAFHVVKILDLNSNPAYREPIHIHGEKTFCCYCCTTLPLIVDVRAPMSGYCPGQIIPLQVAVDNQSSVHVYLVKVTLRKVLTYRVLPSYFTVQEVDDLVTVQEGPAPARSFQNWALSLEVPTVQPSNLEYCTIIDLHYDLKVECCTNRMHISLGCEEMVTIGTEPIK